MVVVVKIIKYYYFYIIVWKSYFSFDWFVCVLACFLKNWRKIVFHADSGKTWKINVARRWKKMYCVWKFKEKNKWKKGVEKNGKRSKIRIIGCHCLFFWPFVEKKIEWSKEEGWRVGGVLMNCLVNNIKLTLIWLLFDLLIRLLFSLFSLRGK